MPDNRMLSLTDGRSEPVLLHKRRFAFYCRLLFTLMSSVVLLGCSPQNEKSTMSKNEHQAAIDKIDQDVSRSCSTIGQNLKSIRMGPDHLSRKMIQIVDGREGKYYQFQEYFYDNGRWKYIEFGRVMKKYEGT